MIARLSAFTAVALFAMAALVAVATAEQPAVIQAPVVNGRPATSDELFGTVAIIHNAPGADFVDRLLCTGSLISPQVVLTAAHCVAHCSGDIFFESGCEIEGAPTLSVRVAASFRDAAEGENAEIGYAARIYVHEGYAHIDDESIDLGNCLEPPGEDPDFCEVFEEPGLGLAHDIALIELSAPITSVDVVPILPVSMLSSVVEGMTATVTGYGLTTLEDSFFDEEPFSTGALLNIATTTIERVTSTEILSAAEAGQGDACFGDSGGPLYMTLGGDRYVVGVTSRGRLDAEEDCGAGGIYTLAPSYLEWIEAQVELTVPAQGGGRCSISAGPAAPSAPFAAIAVLVGLLFRRLGLRLCRGSGASCEARRRGVA